MELTRHPANEAPAGDDPLAAWVCDGTTFALWSGSAPAGAGPAWTVRELRTLDGDAVTGTVQVTTFHGPRGAAQQAADELSGQRIWQVVAGLPGLAGAIVAVAPDGGRIVLSFAEGEPALRAASELILASDLLPGEDPALLGGPDQVEFRAVGHATHALRDLPAVVPA